MKQYPGQAPLLWPLLERMETLEEQLATMTERCNQLIGYCNQLGGFLGMEPFDANVRNIVPVPPTPIGGDSGHTEEPGPKPGPDPEPKVGWKYANNVYEAADENGNLIGQWFFDEDDIDDADGIFVLELAEGRGWFSVSTLPEIQSEIVYNIKELEKVSEIGEMPKDTNYQVEILEKGELEKNDYMWVIKKPAKVTFKPKQQAE